ncbi:hypothetical protein ANCDUO_19323 [Ancylostoma duodenale]|uniref:Endonuclease/exonuclease/phosphatase domain-containing protein n=1 Tax=Ancylostoma duodenale TaxID=51022 RepID=A0A0C2CLC7_9BILA|nr:hypothetical protein ANCDUO_19323 [Ancylostoma duodenale]
MLELGKKKKTLKIIQVYAPTSASEDEDVEDFYQERSQAELKKSTYTIIMGDFNAKLGRGKSIEKFIGRYGIKQRNERGDRLSTVVESKGYYVGNNKKWLFWNVEVLRSFNTGWDHRLPRAHIHNKGLKTGKTRGTCRMKKNTGTIDGRSLEESLQYVKFQDANDIDADYCFFIYILKGCMGKAETCEPAVNGSRISEVTKQLVQKRRELKRDGSHNLKYSILCKLIRGRVKEGVN